VRLGRAADHSPPSSASVMEEYSYASTHPLGHTGLVTGSLYIFNLAYVIVSVLLLFHLPLVQILPPIFCSWRFFNTCYLLIVKNLRYAQTKQHVKFG